jgi:hypothetical protein
MGLALSVKLLHERPKAAVRELDRRCGAASQERTLVDRAAFRCVRGLHCGTKETYLIVRSMTALHGCIRWAQFFDRTLRLCHELESVIDQKVCFFGALQGMKWIYRNLFTTNALLLISTGAIAAITGLWIVSNGTGVLYDILTLLIMLGLAALLATVFSRWIISRLVNQGDETADGKTHPSLNNMVTLAWKNRAVILTLFTFLFLLSVLRGLVGIGDLMVGYLQLDNLKGQNELVDAQNDLVRAQSRIALTDLLQRTAEQQNSLQTQHANLELAMSSWVELGMPTCRRTITLS